MVKIWARAEILTIRRNFDKSCRYNSRYSTGETPPIKAEWSESSDHLRSTCTRGDITWTRALQPYLEEVSSWRFCRAQIVSRRTTWAPNFIIRAEIFIRRGDFNVRLSSSVNYVAHEFYNSAQLFRLNFGHLPKFWADAYILKIRLNFHEAPIFWAGG